jgi:hypothetical protein
MPCHSRCMVSKKTLTKDRAGNHKKEGWADVVVHTHTHTHTRTFFVRLPDEDELGELDSQLPLDQHLVTHPHAVEQPLPQLQQLGVVQRCAERRKEGSHRVSGRAISGRAATRQGPACSLAVHARPAGLQACHHDRRLAGHSTVHTWRAHHTHHRGNSRSARFDIHLASRLTAALRVFLSLDASTRANCFESAMCVRRCVFLRCARV